MKNLRYHLFTLFLATVFISFTACGNENDQDNREDEKLVIPVEASNVHRGNISAFYANTATLDAEQEATVVSKIRGIVNEIYVEEGDEVKAGQVIAKIEDEQYRIEAARAKATLNRLQNEFRRNTELFEKNLIAAETFQNSQFEYESQKAAYELAELNLAYTSIKSPIGGIISERFVKVGNMIGTDQPVYRVTDFNPLQAILHVPEHEMSKIRKGQQAQLQVDAIPGELFGGHIERISPVVDSQSGTFKVTVFVNENKNMLRPGMFGRVKIVYDTRENIRIIPKSAIMTEDLSQSVYVIRDSLAFKKDISTGYTNGLNIEVINGLEDGEMVVTIGQGSLQDSTKVNVINNL
ncbi:MAG: efflux RND transporter periplasmic adaptor subunit [Balneolaceae bacterium]